MKTENEELLYLLLWTASTILRPTYRNLHESFEGWAHRSGLARDLARLEKRKLLEKAPGMKRIYRLTARGRASALGGCDPEARWSRPWDGRWRLVCFDVPTAQNKQRLKLRRYLRQRRFGCLQKSIWITPDRLDEEATLVKSIGSHVGTLIMLEAQTCAGESNTDLTVAAWDFERINELYTRHLKILQDRPSATGGKLLRQWIELERRSWNDALSVDPLLPRPLSPPGYLGHKAWRSRINILGRIRRMLEQAAFAMPKV